MSNDQAPDTTSDVAEQHWFKAGLRWLPMPVRLALIALVAAFLIALPLLIIFGPWELRDEPPVGPLTGLPPSPAGSLGRPAGWLVFQAGDSGRTLAVDLATGERAWLEAIPELPSEVLATPAQIAAMTAGVSLLSQRVTVEQFPAQVVIDLPCHVISAVLSPDRRWVAFQYAADVRQAMGRFGLGVADLSTGQAQRLLPLLPLSGNVGAADHSSGAGAEDQPSHAGAVDHSSGTGALQWVQSLPEGAIQPQAPTTPPAPGPVTSF